MKILQVVIFAAIISLVFAVIYLYEKSQPTEDYFTYYGNVPTKPAFRWPEPISSYTFGHTPDGGPIDLNFVNQLWCKPMGLNLDYILIATRVRQADGFRFENITPPIITQAIDKYDEITNIGIYDAMEIRKGEYQHWTMDDIKPNFNSECYVTAKITARTKLFGLPKVLRFRGTEFDYYVK